MKILYVTTISSTVNAFLIPHIKFLIERGNSVGLAFNLIDKLNPELLELGCKIHNIEFQRNPLKIENYNALKKIKKIILEEGYELVHVHTPVASFITRLACMKMKNVKILYTAHGFHFFDGAPKKNWLIYHTLEKIAARWTDGLITMNEEDYRLASNFKLRNRNAVYHVNGVGIDTTKFIPQTNEMKRNLRKEYGYRDEDFILIYVGELSYRKQQDLLIKAISELTGRIANLKLFLVGDGYLYHDYNNLVKRLNVEEHVEFLGYRDDIQQLMSIADIAVSTSRQEGLPVNVLEAMATGLPLIVTDCRGNRDLVSSGENGIVVGVNDVKACANAIEKLYQCKELRNGYSDKSKKRIQKYSLENVINEMKDIYNNYIIVK